MNNLCCRINEAVPCARCDAIFCKECFAAAYRKYKAECVLKKRDSGWDTFHLVH